jgi:hypothetical protein
MKRVEIQATEYSKVYAQVEGCLFSIGLINDLTETYPDIPKKDSNPFYTRPCLEIASPEVLYEIWAQQLDEPKEWVLGNTTIGLGDVIYDVPTCPTCGEVTYSMQRCPFCNQLLIDPMEV